MSLSPDQQHCGVRPPPKQQPGAPPAPAKGLRLLNPASWAGLVPTSRRWALPGWIPSRQATYLTGAGSAGKSLLAQQLCTCIAAGVPFLGMEVSNGVAIYVTCEDDDDELQRRQVAICESLGVSLESLAGQLHLSSLVGEVGNELATFDHLGRLATTPRWAELQKTVIDTGAIFVALDNVAHLFSGNEIVRSQVAGFCGLLNRLAIECNTTVLFLGHPNKKGEDFSGSTAWENQVRSRLFIETPTDKDGDAIDPDVRKLSVGKANYSRNGETLSFRWHRWAFVREEDIEATERARVAAEIAAANQDTAFLRCLAKITEEKRATSASKSASNYAPKMFAAMPSAKGMTSKGFEAALQRLLHTGKIVNAAKVYQRDNRAWVTGLGLAPTPAPTPAPTLHKPCTDPDGDAA
ncbi:MAG: hypothetical protein CFE37_00110 [Alphaproteobacteria bacterium PA4]|nr:MAG: hypothetical protein CFE37_00110 [Alphaproteobacteria bacterium PA4]